MPYLEFEAFDETDVGEHEMTLSVQKPNYPDLHEKITFKIHVSSAVVPEPEVEELELEPEGLEFNHKLVIFMLGITLIFSVAVVLMATCNIGGAPEDGKKKEKLE